VVSHGHVFTTCHCSFALTTASKTARHPAVPERSDLIGSGAQRMPSCRRREVAFVLRRPVRRSIDGGGVSSLACCSAGPARSTREKVADVHCGIGVPRPSLGDYVGWAHIMDRSVPIGSRMPMGSDYEWARNEAEARRPGRRHYRG
jgi:hypothetical protein